MAENECETNADTSCLCRNFVVFNPTFRTVNDYAYDNSIKPIENAPIVLGATACDNPTSGKTYILAFHKSQNYGTRLDHMLVNTNQLRAYGIPFRDNSYNPSPSLPLKFTTPCTSLYRPSAQNSCFRHVHLSPVNWRHVNISR